MGVVENVKDIAEVIKKIGDIELNRKILTLETEVLDLTRDKRRADEKVEQLERALQFKEKLTFRTPYYYADGDPAPYCPGCWDSKRIAVHVVTHPMNLGNNQCPSCGHVY